MPQVHLSSEIVKRILEGKQSSLIYVEPNNGKFSTGDIVVVREPWALHEDGSIIFRADVQDVRNYEWKPSIFLKADKARLFLKILKAKQVKISELTDEDVQFLGHLSREELHREWNVGLSKEKRPTLGVKFDPVVWLLNFEMM